MNNEIATKKEIKEKVMRQQLHELLDIVLDTNGFEMRSKEITGDKPSAWFYFSGHVNDIEIRICDNGYDMDEDGKTELILREYLTEPLSASKIKRVREHCKRALSKEGV